MASALAPQRYVDEGEVNTPDDVIEEETWTNEATPGLGERLRRGRRTFTLYGLFIVVGLGILFFWSRQFVITIFTNPIVVGLVKYGGLAAVMFVWGAKWQRGVIQEADWLVAKTEEGVEAYIGERSGNDETTVFLPFRGFDWLGFKSRQLQLGELGPGLARAAVQKDPTTNLDDPARVRVDDALTAESDTMVGTVIASMTSGFKPDPFGRDSDVYLEPPDEVDSDMYAKLCERLRQLREEELPEKETDIEMWREKAQNRLELLKETDDDRVDKFINRSARLAQVYSNNNDGGSDGEEPINLGNGEKPAIGGPDE